MQRLNVNSSHIRSIGYDPAGERLEIEFSNGAIYQYEGVSQDEHDALHRTDSIGKLFHLTIKGKRGSRVA